MQKVIVAVVVLAFMAVGLFDASGQSPAETKPTFLAVLKKGQPVSLKDVSGRYELSILDGVKGVQGHKIVEVASDHVVVHDISGITETCIPVYSIKSIVRLKVPKD